jgi:hypothetical protein
MLTGHMKSLIGIRNFDDALLKKAREDAEAWAVLNGDNVDAVQKLLGKMNLDAAIRVYFRTAPAYRRSVGENSIFSGTASMTAQIISSKTGEKSAVVLSPAMGTAEHPARKALDRFDASMSALDYAAREMLKQLEGSQAIGRLNDIRKEQSLNDAPVGNDLQKVLFVIEGEIRGEGINEVEQRVGDMQIETMLSRKLRHALKLKNFDDNTLAKVRGNAEQWAVLMGGEMNEVQTVLDKHNVDSIIRVKYETSAKPYGKADQWGNAIYTAVASVQAEVVGRKDKAVQAKIVSPEMGNEEHKAKAALDEFDAGIAALDYATDKMLNQLLLDSGVVSLMGAPASPQKNTVENIAEEPRKPTVAVLWVKPEFGYWSIPRARQPGLNMRKRQKMKAFVDHVKQTGSIGVDVANYLVQGLVASGQLSPIENSKKSREEVAEIQNKILEYRMAGWVDEKLPITDPVEITKDLGADFVVTAKITKIWENVSSVSGPFVSKGHQSGFAEVEMIVTDVKTGKTKTVKGEGSFGRSGYGLVMTFDPANMALDKFMIGGAVKQALFNAASRLVL